MKTGRMHAGFMRSIEAQSILFMLDQRALCNPQRGRILLHRRVLGVEANDGFHSFTSSNGLDERLYGVRR